MKYVSIDIETTGLDPKKHEIIEIGAVFDDLSGELDTTKTFHCYVVHDVYPTDPWCAVSHQTIFERIRDRKKLGSQYNFLTPSEVMPAFMRWLRDMGYETISPHSVAIADKITIAGKNFQLFDLKWLDEKLKFSSFVKYHHRMIDPAVLFLEKDDTTVPDLSTCLKRAGLDSHVTHTAVEDAIQVCELIRHKFHA